MRKIFRPRSPWPTTIYFPPQNVQDHMLTTKQMKMTRVQTMKTVSMASGIFVGCVLGMFPLLWPEEWRIWQSADAAEMERGKSRTLTFSDDFGT